MAALTTARLRLRPVDEPDRSLLISLRSSPEVRRFLGGPVDLAMLDGVVNRLTGQPGVFRVAVAETDHAIGCVAVHEGHGEHELSYELLPSMWGRGYATEAAQAVLGWVWASTSIESVIAVTQRDNERSRRLLDRLGFEFEAEFAEWDAQQCRYRIDAP